MSLVHLVHEVCVGNPQRKLHCVFKTMAAETPIVADHSSYLSSVCTNYLVQHNFILTSHDQLWNNNVHFNESIQTTKEIIMYQMYNPLRISQMLNSCHIQHSDIPYQGS